MITSIVFDFFGVIYSECSGLDDNLLKLILELKNKGYKLVILSNLDRKLFEKYFSKYNLNFIFDEIILSSDLGVEKPNKEIFEKTKEILNVNYSELLFIDDQFRNVSSAEKLGIKIHHYESFDKFINFLKEEELVDLKC